MSRHHCKITTGLALLCLIPVAAALGGEAGYDSTLGDVHTQVSFSYNIAWDREYAALPGQPSQLVLPGVEVLEQLDLEAFTDEERHYLVEVLGSDGAKAVLVEDWSAENPHVFVPIPSYTEPRLDVPEAFQNRPGVWLRLGSIEQGCDWQWREQGSHGDSVSCNCHLFMVKCCGTCPFQNYCFHCSSPDSERLHLEGLYGPDPRWRHERPFAEVEPGQRLEVEAQFLD